MSIRDLIRHNLKEIFVLVISSITALTAYTVAAAIHPINELVIENAYAITQQDIEISELHEDIDTLGINIYTICGALDADCKK